MLPPYPWNDIDSAYIIRSYFHRIRLFVRSWYRSWWQRYIKICQFSMYTVQIELRPCRLITSKQTLIANVYIGHKLPIKPSFGVYACTEHCLLHCRRYVVLMDKIRLWWRAEDRARHFTVTDFWRLRIGPRSTHSTPPMTPTWTTMMDPTIRMSRHGPNAPMTARLREDSTIWSR